MGATLALHELSHLLAGIVLWFVLARVKGYRGTFKWILLTALFVDVDHLVDYFATIGPRVDLEAVVGGSYFVSSGRAMVPLHSWELTAGIFALGLVAQRKREDYAVTLIGIGLGLLGHLLVDQFWYNQPWGTYFLALRWLHGFADPRFW